MADEVEPQRGDSASTSSTRTLLGIVAVVAMAAAGFGVTAAARSGGSTDSGETTETPAPSTTSVASSDVATEGPTVIEVELGVVAPIQADENGLPLEPDGSFVGTGSIDAVTSPIVGTSTAALSVDDGRTVTAAPSLSNIFSSVPPSVDDLIDPAPIEADLDEVGPAEPSPLPEGVDPEEVLDLVEELAGDYAAEETAADPPPEAGGGEATGGDAPGTGTATDDEPRLADPCADLDDPERCPDPGEPGTIIETFALTVPPPLRVTVHVPGAELCGPVETTQFEQRIAIESNTPLTSFDMRYWRAGWPTAEYTDTISLSTPTAEADAWLDAFDASTTDPPPPIIHCATLSDMRPDWGYDYHADALDVFDQEWTTRGRTPPFFPGPEALVPPTFLLQLDDNELLVSAPHRADQRVAIMAFQRNSDEIDFPIDPCATTSRNVDGFALPAEPIFPTLIDVPILSLRENGYDHHYVYRTLGAVRLDEAATYRLCVHTSTVSPSFSAGLEQTLAYDITTPDALSMTFDILRVDAQGSGGLPERALSVDIAPVGRGVMVGYPWCGLWRNGEQIEGDTEIGATVCRSDPQSSALYDRGARLTMSARGVDGVLRESSAIIPVRTCRMPCVIPAPEVFRFELPTGRTSYDFFCGLFGDECESANDEESFGAITIEVSYDNEGGSIQSGWAVSEAQELGDRRLPPPETPRLDTQATPLARGDRTRPDVIVPVLADRPVTVEVELLAPDGGQPCMLDGAPTSKSSDSLSESHEIVFADVCPGQNVFVIVELTDADERTSRWHGAPGSPGLGPGEMWLRGVAYVPWFTVWASAEVTVSAPATALRFERFDLSISGNEIGWNRRLNLGPSEGFCNALLEGEITRTSRRGRTEPDERVLITTDRSIEIEFVVDADVVRTPDCVDVIEDHPPAFAASAVIDWDDVELGQPIEVTSQVPIPELGPDAFVTATAIVTIHQEGI